MHGDFFSHLHSESLVGVLEVNPKKVVQELETVGLVHTQPPAIHQTFGAPTDCWL